MIDVVIFLGLFVGLFGWYLHRASVSRSMWLIGFAGFALRVAFVLVDNVVQVFAGYADASGYERTLWFVADQWRAGVVEAPLTVFSGPGHGGYYEVLYSTILSPVYFFFGRSPVMARLTMGLFGALIAVNVYLIGRELLDERAGIWAGAIAAVFPYWVYLSGILYRDTIVVLLFSWMVYFLLRWQTDASRRALAISLGAMVLGLSLRLENIPAIAALYSVAIYTTFQPSIRQKAISGLALVGGAFLFVRRFGDRVTLQGLAARRRGLARDESASYLTDFAYETIPELVAFAPIGMLYFALVPFPWQVVNELSVLALFQNILLWYPIVILAIVGTRDALTVGAETRATLPVVVFVLVGLFTYGLVEGNVGPAMRHRSQFQFVVFALAGVALGRRIRVKSSSRDEQMQPDQPEQHGF